ncbi:MAG: hypothetical protein ABH864_07335 [archaeon]
MAFGSMADILFQWEGMGVFDFALPFLLVFVIVYGILTSTRFFGKNNGVYVIISLVIGLMALRYDYFFSAFLAQLFPRLGVGLAILLVVLILVGLFIGDKDHYWRYILMAIGAVIAIAVLWQASDAMGWNWTGTYGSESVGWILFGVIMIGAIIAVIVSNQSDSSKTKEAIIWPRFPDPKS